MKSSAAFILFSGSNGTAVRLSMLRSLYIVPFSAADFVEYSLCQITCKNQLQKSDTFIFTLHFYFYNRPEQLEDIYNQVIGCLHIVVDLIGS